MMKNILLMFPCAAWSVDLLPRFLGIFFTAFLLTNCASMGSRTVQVNTAQIQQKLNAKLTQPLTMLNVFQVQLSDAVVSMDTTKNRMYTGMQVSIQSALMAQPLHGHLDFSGVLQYDTERNAVVLGQAALESLQFQAAGAEMNKVINALGQQLVSQWMHTLVLYQLKPEDLQWGQKRYQPTDFQLTNAGVRITLTPQP